LRLLLAGTGISFGMYAGKTPEREAEVAGIRWPVGETKKSRVHRMPVFSESMKADL
jgi:hypothetical protein